MAMVSECTSDVNLTTVVLPTTDPVPLPWSVFSDRLFHPEDLSFDVPKAWMCRVASELHRLGYTVDDAWAILDYAAAFGSVEALGLVPSNLKDRIERLLPDQVWASWATHDDYRWTTSEGGAR